MTRQIRSSGPRDEWRTPPDIFALLDAEFGFTIDAAATDGNALCSRYFTAKHDAFKQEPLKETIFINPPYSQTASWVTLADRWSIANGNTVVLLVPAATDTRWWLSASMRASEIRLLVPRVKFLRPDGTPQGSPPFGSAVIVYRSGPLSFEQTGGRGKYDIFPSGAMTMAHIYTWHWKQE